MFVVLTNKKSEAKYTVLTQTKLFYVSVKAIKLYLKRLVLNTNKIL